MEADSNKKTNKRLITIAIIFGVIILLLVVSMLYLLFSRKAPSVLTEDSDISYPVTKTEEVKSDENEVEVAPATYKFIGKFVSSTLPIGWTIKEYSDQTGMDQFVDNGNVTFSGLTAMEVLDENQTVIFSIKGIDGIGGGGGCSEVTKFADTEASYIQLVKDETDELGFEPTKVIDMTGKNYSVIFSLGLRLRRSENKMYLALNDNLTMFNTACGINAQFATIEEQGFTVNDGENSYTANAYSFGINKEVIDDVTLTKLDDVLNTMISI